jgi:hypothetical protein
MNYELARELKDAGFPQGTTTDANRYNHLDSKGNPCAPFYPDAVYVPTLTELIEACGDGFETLSRDTTTEKMCWIANNYHDADSPEEKVLGWYEGSTPEEAVANLWLALNKK